MLGRINCISMSSQWMTRLPALNLLSPLSVVVHDPSVLWANVTMCFNYFLSKIRRRRQQRRATRPASFPGPRSDSLPTTDASHGVSTVLKPPRQGSVYAGDDDLVTIDGFTYRHLVQDVTNFKTMLLKLKRVIQEVSASVCLCVVLQFMSKIEKMFKRCFVLTFVYVVAKLSWSDRAK